MQLDEETLSFPFWTPSDPEGAAFGSVPLLRTSSICIGIRSGASSREVLQYVFWGLGKL